MSSVTEDKGMQTTALPDFLHPLFWEYDPKTIDLHTHAGFIMGRIMERGTWASMTWLLKEYSKDQITLFLKERGARILPPRDLNYWAFVCGIPEEERLTWLKEARESPYDRRNRVPH